MQSIRLSLAMNCRLVLQSFPFFLIILILLSQRASAQDSTSCLQQSNRLYTSGNYSEAYKSFAACLKDVKNTDPAIYHTCLLYMGICALENAEYKKAVTLLHAAENYFNTTSDNYILCQQQLAALSKRQGNYDEAENILLRLLAVQENKPTTNCPLKAITLNDLGVIYKRLGQYDRSIHYLSQSLHLKQTCLHPDDLSITISLNNLAGVFLKQKTFAKADSLYTESVKIKTRQCGPDHPSTLIAWNNLAELKRQQGNYKAALEILQDVRNRKAHSIGKNNLSYATTLHTIANVYYASGNYNQALHYCREALPIKEHIGGKTSSTRVHSLILQAKIYHALHQDREALAIYDFILETKKEEIDTYFKYLSEEEKIQYVKTNTTYWKDFTSFVFDIENDSSCKPNKKKVLLNKWVEHRWYFSGIILEETQRQHRLWESIKDSMQLKSLNELKQLKDAIARTYLLKSKEDAKSTGELNKLIDRAAYLEQNLTTSFSIDKRKQYYVKEFTNALDSKECLVEIVKPLQPSGKYLALIYIKNAAFPYKVWLGEASRLDNKEYTYYRNAIKFKLENKNSLNIYWQPIADFIATYPDIKTVYLAREGIYEYLNIHTLLSDSGTTASSIIYLNKPENIISYKAHTPVIAIDHSLFIYHPLYGTIADCAYKDLPGTKYEADTILAQFEKKSLKTTAFSEDKATETCIKKDGTQYSIIHIATHGYSDINSEGDYTESMVHSGLVLSGVCDAPDIGAQDDPEDGILTAYEIAQLNLSSTELVVLSACQSGLGIMDSEEGVLGLQRGLFVAGAKRVLVSLWKIDDAVTAQWMHYFYANLLETKSCSVAYMLAQQKIKSLYPSPYYWGAFVLLQQ